MGEFGIGQPVPREEDPYLVRGVGRYVDDVQVAGQVRGYVLRSPHGHARIVSISADVAKTMPGVLLVLTGENAAVKKLSTQRPQTPRKRRDGSPAFASPQPFLARERVRYVGDPVAFVVAETLEQAKDAAEAIEVGYEMLAAVATTEDAITPGAVAVWEGAGQRGLRSYRRRCRRGHDESHCHCAPRGQASHGHQRLTTNSMEPRGCIAEYALRDQRTTLRCTVQGPHMIRRAIRDGSVQGGGDPVPHHRRNVGGGFGMKGGLCPEYVLATLAARLTGRPVKWISERGEGSSDEHCRGRRHRGRARFR